MLGVVEINTDPVTAFSEEWIKRFLVTAEPLAKGKVVEQPHEIGEVNVSDMVVALDYERVLVILGSGIFAVIGRAGNDDRHFAQRIDENDLVVEKIHATADKLPAALFRGPLVEVGVNVRTGHDFDVTVAASQPPEEAH